MDPKVREVFGSWALVWKAGEKALKRKVMLSEREWSEEGNGRRCWCGQEVDGIERAVGSSNDGRTKQ